ncbi:MAG: tyrosine-protein phosphatase [Clostridia bacterium]
MFIDIHSHILPGLDDGSKNLQMTEAMLSQASKEGIKEIIATPHFISKANTYTKEELKNTYTQVVSLIEKNELDLKLHLGNELFFDIDAIRVLESGECLPLASSSYVLIEFPFKWRVDIVESILYNLELSGYKIILAHIERYENFDNPKILASFIEKGCLAQINSSILFDKNKSRVNYMLNLIENNYIHFIASDCHSDRHRSPKLKDAYKKVNNLIGERANDLFYNNAKAIIENKKIEISEPKRFNKIGFWGGISNWINKR